MHSGSISTLMLAVYKLVKTLISENLCKNRSTSVHQPGNLKVVVSTKQRSFAMKYMHYHLFMYLYVAKIMHGMHSGSVSTLMLTVLKFAKTLISANLYKNRSGIVHQLVKPKVVVTTQQRSFSMKYMH